MSSSPAALCEQPYLLFHGGLKSQIRGFHSSHLHRASLSERPLATRHGRTDGYICISPCGGVITPATVHDLSIITHGTGLEST